MRKLTLVFGLVTWCICGITVADGDPAAGKIKAYTCTGCHGIPGYKNTYPTYKVPKIGGQGAIYLSAALSSYQTGARKHPTMMLQAESLSDVDIEDIVAWLSSQETSSSMDTPASESEKSQLCLACHGPDGMGTDPVNPALAGQHASYMIKALQDYRDGSRTNAIMGGIAASLSDKDIEELAHWYAGMNGLRDLSHR